MDTWLILLVFGVLAVVALGLISWGVVKLIREMDKQSRIVVDEQGKIKVKTKVGSAWVEEEAETVLEKESSLLTKRLRKWIVIMSLGLGAILVALLLRKSTVWFVIAIVAVSFVADAVLFFILWNKNRGS